MMKLLFGIVTLIVSVAAYESEERIPEGLWVSRGYGWVLKSSNWQLHAFEETAISCLERQDLLEAIEDIQVDGDVMTVTTQGITSYVFDKTPTLTGFCAQGITPSGDEYTRDALQLFDIVVETFAENYAYFDLRGIDWEALTSSVRQTLTSESTDKELFEAFSSILLPLDDDSAFIVGERRGVQKEFPLVTQLEKEFAKQTQEKDLGVYVDAQLRRCLEIINQYMDGDLNGQVGDFLWGHFKDVDVGYIQLFGTSLDPEDDEEFFADFEAALNSFSDKDALVLDVRGVEGNGDDDIPMHLASYFTSEPVPVFSKRAVKAGGGFTDAIVHSIEPSPSTKFDGKVIMIASGATVGSSEIFTLIMSQLPQVTVLGRNTSGAIGASDRLERMLPNEWIFGLGNHEYMTPDGKMYEKVGVPPDVTPDSELLPLHEREVGIDSWLEMARELASKSSLPVIDTA